MLRGNVKNTLESLIPKMTGEWKEKLENAREENAWRCDYPAQRSMFFFMYTSQCNNPALLALD